MLGIDRVSENGKKRAVTITGNNGIYYAVERIEEAIGWVVQWETTVMFADYPSDRYRFQADIEASDTQKCLMGVSNDNQPNH